MEKPITLTVISTQTRAEIRDTITAGDSDAYPLSITFSDLTAITGTVRFRFVRGDDYWDRDATVAGNVASLMLEPAFYAATGTELWVSFEDSNLYTPLHVYFRDIRVPGGNVAAETSQPYPAWAADMRALDFDIGTVETLEPGADATAGITGDIPDKVLNLGIPQGDKGDAATVAVGTVTTLDAGESATVANSGTSAAAVLDFGIPKGDKGDAGEMTIGTVTTLAPGESATVTNSGTSTDAVLDIGIPKGDKGDKGDTGASGTIDTSTLTDLTGLIAGDGANIRAATAADGDALPVTGGTLGASLAAIGYFETTNHLTNGASDKTFSAGITTQTTIQSYYPTNIPCGTYYFHYNIKATGSINTRNTPYILYSDATSIIESSSTNYNITTGYKSWLFVATKPIDSVKWWGHTLDSPTVINNLSFINLTTTFGAGNEPSKDEMDYLMATWENEYLDGTQQVDWNTWLLIKIKYLQDQISAL